MYCRFKTKDSSYCNYHNYPLDFKDCVECHVHDIEKCGDMLYSTEHVKKLEQQNAKLVEALEKIGKMDRSIYESFSEYKEDVDFIIEQTKTGENHAKV